jgi:hypothetical protein
MFFPSLTFLPWGLKVVMSNSQISATGLERYLNRYLSEFGFTCEFFNYLECIRRSRPVRTGKWQHPALHRPNAQTK